MTKLVKLACLGLLLVVPMVSFVGCENGGGGGGGDSSSVAGTWQLTSNEGTMYFVFGADGSWELRGSPDASAGSSGSYSVDGSHITGTWQGAVKGGTIDATVSGTTMTLSFVEITPPKTVAYSGSKM
jgi:hypothetical protein